MEHGQPLRHNDKVASLLKDVGQRLMIAEREVDAVPIKKAEPGSTPPASTSTPEASAAAVSGYLSTRRTGEVGVTSFFAFCARSGRWFSLSVEVFVARGMVWYGVVWFGVLWYGMVW